MNVLDELGQGNYNLGNTGFSFLDADTLKDQEGKSYRIQGIDAPEVTKYFNGIKPGTAGGDKAYETIANLANKKGFTKVIKTGEFDEHGRELIDLHDAEGNSFRQQALKSGIFDPTAFTTKNDRITYELGRAERERGWQTKPTTDDWQIAKDTIDTAAAVEGYKQQGFKRTALNEEELAAMKEYDKQNGTTLVKDYYNQSDVQMRDYNRDLDNMANSPFATSLDTGLKGVKSSMYGALKMLGDNTGWDWAQEIGEDGVKYNENLISELPKITTSYKEVLEDGGGLFGKKGWLQYIMNNAGMSLPYMGVTIGSAVLAAPGAAIATAATGSVVAGAAAFGTITAAPAAMYAGQIYNEQGEGNRNTGAAIAGGIMQATLDRLGLKFLRGGSLLSKKTRNDIVNQLMQQQGLTKKEAIEKFANATKAEVASFAGDAAKFAKDQLAKRNVARAMAQKVATGAIGEGATEAMQEAIGYTAANMNNNFETWDAGKFVDRIIEASIAGSTLGAGFSAPGTIFDAGAWADVAYRKAPASAAAASKAGKNQEKDIRKYGHAINIQDRNDQLDIEATDAQATGKVESDKGTQVDMVDANDRVQSYKDTKEARNFPQHAKDLFRAIPGLWRGMTRFMGEDIVEKSDTARYFIEGLGGYLQRSTTGSSYENKKHHDITKIKNRLGSVAENMHQFGVKETAANRKSFSDQMYQAWNKGIAKAKRAGRQQIRMSDLDPADRTPQMRLFIAKLNRMGNDLHAGQKKYNENLGFIHDYLLKYKSFDKNAIETNKAEFTNLLQSKYNVTSDQAQEIANAILNIDGVADIDDAFSVTSRKAFTPSSHKKRTLALSEDADFQNFMERDLFTNISNASKSAVRYTTLNEFTGKNNEKLNYQYSKIEAELIDSGMRPEDARKRVNKLASDTKDYFDAESGNYKRIKNDFINNVQKNILFITTVTSLPLATLSNFVEIAMVYKGLTKDQIFGKNGIAETGKTFGKELGAILKRRHRDITGDSTPVEPDTRGHEQLRKLGYLDWEVGAAHTTGVTETHHGRQKILDTYFKTILLQQWTNATRASRAAIAGDFIVDHLNRIKDQREQSRLFTNEVAESAEFMRNLGIDIEFMMDAMDTPYETMNPQQKQRFDDQMREATFNFINEAVVLPQSANRPKIFQDPRFALFTQFQGFISTFTANHIPKLWGEYVRRGSPAMKYNAYGMMLTMMALGFASQYLKDLLKYGEQNPHFDSWEIFRRGIGASGLLGTSERAIDFVFPIYESRYANPVSWTFGTISGESAAISKVGKLTDVGQGIVEEGGFKDKFWNSFFGLSPAGRVAERWLFGG